MSSSSQNSLYEQTAASYGAAIDRLARAYESDPDKRLDLQQEIHLALWRSFDGFDERCSLRAWIYRVAHNVAASHVVRQSRSRAQFFVNLDEVDAVAHHISTERELDHRQQLSQLMTLIHELKPVDRQVMVSYLEGLDAASIGEITGLSSVNVATKIHRIKRILAQRFDAGGHHAE